MDLEHKPEWRPDDDDDKIVSEEQALLTERMLKLIDSFSQVMAAVHALKPSEIGEAKGLVLGIVDEFADMLEPGIYDDDSDSDSDSEDLFDAEDLGPLDGPGSDDFSDDCDLDDILDDKEAVAEVDKFLTELMAGVQSLPEDHPLRSICNLLDEGRSKFYKARDLKNAADEFRADLGLPPES
jgi:hypothetical protein